MRKKRPAVVGWPLLFCALFALAASPVVAAQLQEGIGYVNTNGAKLTVTYSWSGHYPGKPEV